MDRQASARSSASLASIYDQRTSVFNSNTVQDLDKPSTPSRDASSIGNSSTPAGHFATGIAAGDVAPALDAAKAALGPKRPRPHKLWQKRFVKILVVGDAGLGKTTMIRALLSVPGQRLELHDGSETSADAFRRDPDSLCSRVTWEDQEERVKWVYMIQDTPGYGDNLNIWNNIVTMKRYVEDQNQRWLSMEMDKKRIVDPSDVEDPRVDLCIFCLQPHRLRPIDLRFMLELGKVVPVVPVVMKADTMTIREALTYRQEVYDKIRAVKYESRVALGGCSGPIGVYEFSEAARERAGLKGHPNLPMPPFLVVASNWINQEMAHAEPPVYWPERTYPWGTSQAFNPAHSDLLHLRALILHEASEEISASKRQRYQAWRKSELNKRSLFRRFLRFVARVSVPLAVGVIISKSGITPASVFAEASKLLPKGKRGVEPTLPAMEQKVKAAQATKGPTKRSAPPVQGKAEAPMKEEFRFPWAGGKKS